MNNIWSEFVTQKPVGDYQTDQTHLFDLSYRAIIKVSGADAQEFLHGQFSSDIKALDGNNSQLSSLSTPKGRLLGIFRATRVDDFYLLSMPRDIAETLAKRLQMFVMRSDVKVEIISDTWSVSALSGDNAETMLTDAELFAPEAIDDCQWIADKGMLVVRVPGKFSRFELYAPTNNMVELWGKLSNTSIAEANFWKLEQIQNGLAEIYPETSQLFVAQMANLHITGAVNFKKGCYPGQEVVARLQYLGKLKRKMYHYKTKAETLPAVGSEVMLENGEAASGNIVETAFDEQKMLHCLIVLKAADVESGGALTIKDFESDALELDDLPYELTD